MEPFLCPIQTFPCKYPGLPLHVRQLRRVEFQPLIDKLANRWPTWKGRFLNRSGLLKQVNSVLSVMPTYFLSIFAPSKWVIEKLDRIRRDLFGKEQRWGVEGTVWCGGKMCRRKNP